MAQSCTPERGDTTRLLTRAFPGWRCWFGSATGRWWALPPPGSWPQSLVEALTPEELAVRIRRLSAGHPQDGTIRTADHERTPR